VADGTDKKLQFFDVDESMYFMPGWESVFVRRTACRPLKALCSTPFEEIKMTINKVDGKSKW
jgi:hypothetical protein